MKLKSFDVKYKTETGVILDQNGNILTIVPGEPHNVDFPQEYLEKLHEKIPGGFRVMHTHPIGHTGASSTDKEYLTSWAKVFHPFPSHLAVITIDRAFEPNEEGFVTETNYVGIFEPKSLWQRSDRKGRNMTIIEESPIHRSLYQAQKIPWLSFLLSESYTFPFDKVHSCLHPH